YVPVQPLEREEQTLGDRAEPSEIDQPFQRRSHLCQQRQVLRAYVRTHFHWPGGIGSCCRLRHGFTRFLVFTEVMPVGPMPQGKIAAIRNERRGKELILDACELHGARLLEGLALVPGNAELLVLEQIYFSTLLEENRNLLRRFVNPFVTKSAAPGDCAGQRPAVERNGSLHGELIVLRETKLLRGIQVAVA